MSPPPPRKPRILKPFPPLVLRCSSGLSPGFGVGPWLLGCDLTDSDTAYRLKTRFRAAAQKAALAAGAVRGVVRCKRIEGFDFLTDRVLILQGQGANAGCLKDTARYAHGLTAKARGPG